MDLTKGDISSLIKKIAVPASIGFFFNTMYNVVDTFYAGQISTEAIAALSISFPIFFIILAMGSGINQGSTALIANALGEKHPTRAKRLSRQAVSFGIIVSLTLTAIGFKISPFLFRLLGAKEQYLGLSLDYMNIILLGTVFFMTQSILNASLLAQGDSKSFRNMLITGFFLNLILNPMLMHGWLFLPAMGIKGIALATVLIQMLGTVYMGYKVSKTKLWEHFYVKNLKPQLEYFKDIAHQGFPASLNMMTVALGIFIITFFISKFGSDVVAAYGIATRIEQIVLVPNIGLNMALISFAGQNNGAKRLDRVRHAIQKTLSYGFALAIVGGIAVFFLGGKLMSLFTKDANVISIGAGYLHIASFIFCGYIILFQFVAMMQGLKKPLFGLSVGVVRQLILPIIIFPLFSNVFGLGFKGIWWGVFAIIWSSAIAVYLIGMHILHKKIIEVHGKEHLENLKSKKVKV